MIGGKCINWLGKEKKNLNDAGGFPLSASDFLTPKYRAPGFPERFCFQKKTMSEMTWWKDIHLV
jgi:hypothetical protein